MNIFSKDSAQSSASGNPIVSFHPLGVVVKNRSQVIKMVRQYKIRHQSRKNASLKWATTEIVSPTTTP